MKSLIPWVVPMYDLETAQHFRGTSGSKSKPSKKPTEAGGKLWRWGWYVPLKHQAASELHSVSTQKTVTLHSHRCEKLKFNTGWRMLAPRGDAFQWHSDLEK
jgi:hypothetical protein